MALRFQRHSKTPRIDPGSLTIDDLRKINNLNEPLASFVSNFFDAQHECEDGYWYGGENKRSWLEGTALPVALDPGENGEPTPLEVLLGDLYNLMRRHYAAINYDDMKRFKVPLKTSTQPAGQADNEDNPEAATAGKNTLATNRLVKAVDYHDRLKTRRLEGKARPQNSALPPQDLPPQPGSSTATSAPVLLRTAHIRTQPIGEAKRVLDTHEELLKTLERILDDGGLSMYKDDKWYDQFDGLKSSYSASDKKPSGQARSAEKRKAVTEVNETRIRRQKLQLPGVRGETWRGSDIPSGLATVEEKDES